jgi:Reverse transcriptase (RNA-dependent DNA polymerase)
MINNSLTWYLDSINILPEQQSGFSRGRSTIDQLVRLESFVCQAFVHSEHATAVVFDIEKADDTTWKHGVLQDIQNTEPGGRLPTFVSNFLSNHKFNVRVGPYLSDTYKQEMDVPQGIILSVTL